MHLGWFGALLVAAAAASPVPSPQASHAHVVPTPSTQPSPSAGPAPATKPAPAVRPVPSAGSVPVAVPVVGHDVTIAKYAFDDSLAASLADGSGRGHLLSVVSAHGGAVRTVPHGQGTALAFPASCVKKTACPHVALRSPSTADLNPGTRNIAFGADVLLAAGQTSKGENIVQKGYSATSSQWKLQIDGTAGHPSCVLVDDKTPTIRIAHSSVTVADGRWHSVQCHRIGGTLTVFVDGVDRGRIDVPATLSVTNDRPLSIGAKGAFVDNDQFNGALDNVWVQIG